MSGSSSPSQPMVHSTPTEVVRACVVSGGITTPYQVAGRGLPTLVLSSDRGTVSALLHQASPERRVIAPDLGTGASGTLFTESHSRGWLVAFLEALGLEGVRLLVDASYSGEAYSVAMVYPELVSSVELLGGQREERLTRSG